MGKIGVMLMDDSAQTRDSLRRMLELENDIQVVGEVSNADDALWWAEALSPNVIIMDIRMDHINGLEAIRLLNPNPPKDTDGRREDSGRGWVRELQGRWPGVLG